jgi:ubiquinone/menaquinone biosynthesis C-methylase UbiE
MNLNFREILFRAWYWYVNKADKNAEIVFMNYGFGGKDCHIPLDEYNEPNRYSIQLYHHLAKQVEIKNKHIVEIGCGRGGGLSYITSNFSPASAKGIDLVKKAVSFCNRHHKLEGLSFSQGDAQNLSLENNTCDVVINVESSHRYPSMSSFLKEVTRILRPDGHFLFTDFRYDHEMDDLKKELEKSGMSVLKERYINREVVDALRMDDERKRQLVKKLAPRFLHKTALNFAGTVGSDTFNQFDTQKYIYFSYVLKKAV